MILQTPKVPREPHAVLGMRMAQNGFAIYAISQLLDRLGEPPARIIELGTCKGGMSILLKLYAMTAGVEFVTFDHVDKRKDPAIFAALAIDFRNRKFYGAGVEDMIAGPGVTLLLVDGSNKPKEFNFFAPHLKPGDVVLVHDYSPDRSAHNRTPFWKCTAITDEDTREAKQKLNLKPFHQDLMLSAAWLSLRRGP